MDKTADKRIKAICMLSTHGYFDPVPQLGKTDTGGQVLFVLQLARALAQLGYKTDIYTRWFDRSKKQIEPMPDCPDVRVIRIPAGNWQFMAKEQIYGVLDELAENMIALIKQHGLNYDLFHGHYVDAGIVCLKVAKKFAKPTFFTAHSLGAWKKQRVGGAQKHMEKTYNFTLRIKEELRIFQNVTAQTTTSREEREKIEELYHFKSNRMEFIPPGVDINKFRPLKKNEAEENTRIQLPEKYIFVVSRIAKAKGHNLLLPAFMNVLQKIPDLQLIIAGGSVNPDEEEKEVMAHMKQFIKTGRLEKNVHLVGGIPHQELPPYFRQAQCFILPARYEPFGMTALEAMACRVPALVSQFSGIMENLTSGKDCLSVNPLDTNGYAAAIKDVLMDKKLATRLAGAGMATVRARFSWQAIAQRSIKFYQRFI